MVARSLSGTYGSSVSVSSRYRANYDQIARDHISCWRKNGLNPFQDEGVLRHNESETVFYAKKYLRSGDRILDAGCGMGDLMLHFPEHETVGVDISDDYLEIARERGLDVHLCEIEEMIWIQEFDMVLCTEVLEHVFDLNVVVENLLRALKPGGHLIVRVPNEEALSITTDPYEFVHVRRFDFPTMYLLFHTIFGCEVVETGVSGNALHGVMRK